MLKRSLPIANGMRRTRFLPKPTILATVEQTWKNCSVVYSRARLLAALGTVNDLAQSTRRMLTGSW